MFIIETCNSKHTVCKIGVWLHFLHASFGMQMLCLTRHSLVSTHRCTTITAGYIIRQSVASSAFPSLILWLFWRATSSRYYGLWHAICGVWHAIAICHSQQGCLKGEEHHLKVAGERVKWELGLDYLTRASSEEDICSRARASSQNILWWCAWLETDRLSCLATRDSVP